MKVFALTHPQARRLSRPLLAWCAARVWGLDRLPAIELGPHSKPFFPDFPHLHFNLSHSGPYLVCALDEHPLGVDIQLDTARRPGFLDKIASPAERRWLLERGDSPAAAALLWALKESRCKYTGRGLTRPISAISVPLPAESQPLLTADGRFISLRSGPGWQLALWGEVPFAGEIHWLEQPELEECINHDPTGM